MPISDEIRANNKIDYKQKYSNLKRKLKILIYENESYSEELSRAQRQLLQVSRDKSYLLDRLLQYENVESSTSDSEDTLSSDSDLESRKCDNNNTKRKKTNESITTESQTISSTSKKKKTTNQTNTNRSKSTSTGKPSAKLTSMASIVNPSGNTSSTAIPMTSTQSTSTPVIKIESCPAVATCSQSSAVGSTSSVSSAIDGHMTSEELERHLESRRQPLAMLMPEKTPLTVPVELFSNESSSGLPDDDNSLKLSQ